jgi:hypothetical protein
MDDRDTNANGASTRVMQVDRLDSLIERSRSHD